MPRSCPFVTMDSWITLVHLPSLWIRGRRAVGLRGDVEIRNYLRDQAGSRSLVFDLSIAHDRFGSSSHVQQNGSLSHPQDLDAPLRIAAQRS
ncbi:MAG: hypothetical protein ACK56F_31860, partial [bacterium]